MFWIQIAAAVLLIIPSALIFQYLFLADRYDADIRLAIDGLEDDDIPTLKRAA